MERLTYWCDDGMGGGEYRANENGSEYSGPSIDRLAAYEDTGLEPQTISEILDSVSEWYDAHKEGRLLVLPCKVGEKFYYNFLGKTYEGKLTKVVYHEAGVQVYFADYDGDNASRRLNEVFKTREEAEAKLKEISE